MTQSERPMQRQSSRAAVTIQRILDAAGLEFEINGYAGANLNRAMREAEVSKGSWRYHFSDKKDLAQSILRDTLTMDGLRPQQVKLQEVVDIGMILAHRITNEAALRAALRLSVEFNAPTTYETPWPQWIVFNTGQLEEAKQRGELAADVETAEEAFQISAGWTGQVLISHAIDGNLNNLEKRVARMYRNLLTALANPRCLRLVDFAEDRGQKLYADFLAT
ncbi:hypothetical protein [Streptomyces sp. NPDC001165]|uniref:hypothetical protein n=1 Tax=Streptomyces sp. NPDC001165 TaxID=3364546 RepID=UPI0036C85D13